jgi:hypothetical protein
MATPEEILAEEERKAEEEKARIAAEEAAKLEAEKKAKEEAEARRKANPDQELIDKVVQDKVEEHLKEIKEKLDKAYAARDEALKKAAEYERKERDATIARLKEEGKHKEAFEMQLTEERAKREAAELRNTELTRDLLVKEGLSKFKFRSENAFQMTFREVCAQLVKTDANDWVHRSGVSINDFINTYLRDEKNEFLLEAKSNNGTGATKPNGTGGASNTNKSLFQLSQAEVLKMAAEGKLQKTKRK